MSSTNRVSRLRRAADDLCGQLAALALDLDRRQTEVQEAFAQQRQAERDLVIRVLEAARPAFPWLASCRDPVVPLSGHGAVLYAQVVIDQRANRKSPDLSYDWVAVDDADLGLVIAKRARAAVAELVWPRGDLPSGREGGPRLDEVLARLVDGLDSHIRGNGPRRRREATAMLERLRAIQVLLGPLK